MSAVYVVRFGPTLSSEVKLEMWGNVIELLKSFRDAGIQFEVHNDDRCDYATDTGWHNGLTEDEREQIEEYR